MKRILYSSFLFAAIAVAFNSCKKEDPDTETQSAVDNNICETEFTKMQSHINGFAINEQGVKAMRTGCPTIIPPDTIATPGWPRTMIIDYGTSGCPDSIDGKVRKGQVICTFSNRWFMIGSYVKVTLVNYSVNGVSIAVDSIKIIHSGIAQFTKKVFKGVCDNGSWHLEWECDRTFTQTAGLGDTIALNDVYTLSGNASGKNRNGKTYSVNITTPLVKAASCNWIKSGKMDLIPEGMATRTVDFGPDPPGTCDNQASLIINGNSFSFTMN